MIHAHVHWGQRLQTTVYRRSGIIPETDISVTMLYTNDYIQSLNGEEQNEEAVCVCVF